MNSVNPITSSLSYGCLLILLNAFMLLLQGGRLGELWFISDSIYLKSAPKVKNLSEHSYALC